ncbi:hypothetical protein BD410DRAFT_548860 [Rickenella mellea]|uniref:Ricin B lectin domain-containing protein n=1 Tax=Rickenella mellea TaxID=50990 RepID=A0A4Y7PPW3_9AGAM|nr:hypothetical protein BD410DRAFT_548860 [Rickenella mellea]
MDGKLKSGVYELVNDRFHNHVGHNGQNFVLACSTPTDDCLSDTESDTCALTRPCRWKVQALHNGNYFIYTRPEGDSVHLDQKLYAMCNPLPSKKDEVMVGRSPHQWTVKESRIKRRYVIHHTGDPYLCWALLDGELGTHVTLNATSSCHMNLWDFCEVLAPPDPAKELLPNVGTLNGDHLFTA